MGLRLLTGMGNAPAAPANGPGIGEANFLSLLGGAATGGRAAETPEAATEADAASDPAMAAAIAALFPGQVPVDGQGAAADESSLDQPLEEGGVVEGEAVANLLESAAADVEAADAALDNADTLGANADSTDALQDLMQQLSRELGAARDTGARAMPAEVRGPSLGDALTAVNTLSGVTHTATTATTPATAMDQLLRSPVGSPRWADEMGQRLVMMATRGQHEGSLTLTPENLGPMEVRISMSQNTAHVWFGAQQAETRAALHEALPRLREMFAEAGLSLGQTGVSHEAPRRSPEEPASLARREGEGGAPANAPVQAAVQRAVAGVLDLYA